MKKKTVKLPKNWGKKTVKAWAWVEDTGHIKMESSTTALAVHEKRTKLKAWTELYGGKVIPVTITYQLPAKKK